MQGERSSGSVPLRILFVYAGWLQPELGAARGILDVADAMRDRGHDVSTYSFSNAFPDGRTPRYPWVDPRRVFAARAGRFIGARAGYFDVIDANEAALPFTKDELRFSGLLVTNSCGLAGIYADYLDYERRRWSDLIPGNRMTQLVARYRHRQAERDALGCLHASDLVRVLNPYERDWVTEAIGASRSDRVLLTPLGLSGGRRAALESAGSIPSERLARREVLFIGSWILRKGRADLPAIIDAIVRRVPEARFHFAGTYAECEVWETMDPYSHRVRVTPTYPADALPQILGDAAVLMAPSYAEGLPLGVLEALAAGVPAVAYDIPGPRFLLSRIRERNLLIERGDVEGLAAGVSAVLRMDTKGYVDLSTRCREATSNLTSEALAQQVEGELLRLRGLA